MKTIMAALDFSGAAEVVLDMATPRAKPLDNGAMYMRRLHTGDESLLRRFFYSHSKDTVMLRYGYLIYTMSEKRAHRLVSVDDGKGVALGVFSKQADRESLWAVGRYSIETGSAGEISFVVHEDYRRCGLATGLLGELARIAEVHGITRF